MGHYKYTQGQTTFNGAFNIYQAKSGAIMLAMAGVAVSLTHEQICKLPIDCYTLKDFDLDDFRIYYNIIK